ncbi:3-hydroxyacyl-[acyl-carrier-protein] dehydratase FabZ [Sedimentisphaera cyanobacteriorum]|uniref:3-hydroxyacyl-[acyl-carrier-protein] dehydratase FabZ n=1 Tax=Sedimentisphaera cyanobacteriorum TaxID=1940790 RepID=A0A1Q2HRK0_9BACT|nr:3-hydroxyacyl-ACP dehydratase FabZ family protein [Sedimentisphaera cyanobacteriorum]AQQ10077.1 3-hydroxyacyl-[acyl-carrier-protein] dehydratase FabZ [Sedimentisphaera cyanobacteriorum]
MPPKLLFDIDNIDLSRVLFDKTEILKYNPQNYEMQQLDGIIWYDDEKHYSVGFKDVTDDEFWVRGHIPGRPIMPGVIMVEAAAQLSSLYMKKIYGLNGFIGFAGIESANFRGTVVPGDRLIMLCHICKMRSRKYTAKVQGLVDGTMVFACEISGMNV